MNPSSVRLVRDPPCSIAQTVETDERLLDAGAPAVRVARVSAPALSLGVGQSLHTSAAEKARSLGIPVVQRRSGGKGLLHFPGDVVWSVILPRERIGVHGNLATLYASLGAAAKQVLDRFGIRSRWIASPGVFETYCLLSGRGRVLSAGGRALGGAAQHLTRRAILHHGAISGKHDFETISALFGFSLELAREHLTDLHRLGFDDEQSPQLDSELVEALAELVPADASAAP